MAKTRTCSRCKVELAPIRMLDATERTAWSADGARQIDQRYAAEDATASFWTQSTPASGIVRGFLCPKCGRITLYGEPT